MLLLLLPLLVVDPADAATGGGGLDAAAGGGGRGPADADAGGDSALPLWERWFVDLSGVGTGSIRAATTTLVHQPCMNREVFSRVLFLWAFSASIVKSAALARARVFLSA